MISELLEAFMKNRSHGPRWYIYFRALCALAGFAGVAVYFVILLVDLTKRDIYLVVSQMTVGENGYNGTIPIPDLFTVSTNSFSSQNTNATCILETDKGHGPLIQNCTGILEIVDEAPGITKFYPIPNNPVLLADMGLCENTNCSAVTVFVAAFQFPPTNTTIADNSTINMILGVSNAYRPSYRSDSSPITYYNLGYGEGIELTFTWSKYIPINGDPYYINTQASSRKKTLDPIPKSVVYFQYRANTVTVYTEQYTSSIGTVFGSIGGLYGTVTIIFVSLFGMGVRTPWGILPKHIFARSISKPLREEYSVINSSNEVTYPLIDSIPLSPLRNEVTPERLALFTARLARLEALLAKFYLDAEILDSHERYKRENNSMNA